MPRKPKKETTVRWVLEVPESINAVFLKTGEKKTKLLLAFLKWHLKIAD